MPEPDDLDENEPTRQSRLPRWMHHLWAAINLRFWLPCPLCRRPFGGHEWAAGGSPAIRWPGNPNTSYNSGVGVCNADTCRHNAAILTARNFREQRSYADVDPRIMQGWSWM